LAPYKSKLKIIINGNYKHLKLTIQRLTHQCLTSSRCIDSHKPRIHQRPTYYKLRITTKFCTVLPTELDSNTWQ